MLRFSQQIIHHMIGKRWILILHFANSCKRLCLTHGPGLSAASSHWRSQGDNTPLRCIYQPAAAWRTGWPGLGMATASCEKLRKLWKFNALGEVRREDVPAWPRKACWRGWGGVGMGGGWGYSREISKVGGGGWHLFLFSPPSSASSSPSPHLQLSWVRALLCNMPIVITGVES